jgi:hypothetical protein
MTESEIFKTKHLATLVPVWRMSMPRAVSTATLPVPSGARTHLLVYRFDIFCREATWERRRAAIGLRARDDVGEDRTTKISAAMAAARSAPHSLQRQRVPRSAGTGLSGVSSWPLPYRIWGRTAPRARFDANRPIWN